MRTESKVQLLWIVAGLVILVAAGLTVFAQVMGSRAFRGLDKAVLKGIDLLGKKS